MGLIFCFFFFSSRRRHTRCGRDWSSDVCSSDLAEISAQRLTTTKRLAAPFDLGEIGATWALGKIDNDVARKPAYALEILVIKLIGGVGWPMIIFVRAREEIQNGNTFRVETGHIGRQIGVVLDRKS